MPAITLPRLGAAVWCCRALCVRTYVRWESQIRGARVVLSSGGPLSLERQVPAAQLAAIPVALEVVERAEGAHLVDVDVERRSDHRLVGRER